MASIKFDITGDNSNVLRAFRGVQDGVTHTARIVEQQGQSIDAVFNKIKNAASMAFAGFTAKEIVSALTTIRGEFQQSEIAFETMLGSATEAKAMISDLANLAATTPFDMRGVVSGAKQLLAYGIEADKVTETMRRLGDVCAGLGLNLNDLAWLYGTTMTQGRLFSRDLYQFTGRGIPLTEELAKQFGVTKEKVSELVTAGKVGFPEVQKAIWSMTSEGGKFGGLMEKQSKSITGQISNIQDTIEMAINDLGTQTEGVMNTALDITSTVVDHWKDIGEAILAAASAIGLYKAMAVGIAAWDAGVSSVGYQAELSALQAILPLKEEEKKTDLEEAVAKGQLSAAQAEFVASKREEVAAYVEELQTKAATAKANTDSIAEEVNLLKNRDEEAQRTLNIYERQYESALKTGDGIAIETAETNLNSAANEKNTTAKKLQEGQERLSAASKAADTAATEANTAAQQLNTANTARDTSAKGINAQFTLLCQKAQEAWNASMFASPLFWIAAAIVGVTYAVYKLATAETEHEAAIRKSNEAWDEFDNKLKERQSTIESLIRTVQSETASEYEKAEAYQKLSNLAPQLTNKYDQAALASADFAKTQKEVAESMDDAKYAKAVADVESYKKQIENLKVLLQNDLRTGGNGLFYTEQINQNKEALIQAENVLSNIIELRDQAAENAKPIEVRLKEAQENEETRQKIFDFYDEAMTLANDWQSANETINYVKGETRLDEFIAKAQKDISGLREDIKKNPADVNLRLQESEKTKVLNSLLSMKQNWTATGATTIPLIFKANWDTAKQSLNQAKTKASTLANSGSTESYATAFSKAQREYQAAQRKVAQMEKNKSKYTATQYETATQDLKAAKDAYAKLGGDVTGKSAKTAAKANKDRIKEEKKTAKLQEELNNRLKSLQQKNTDEEISLMQEGTEKKLKEIDNDYKKRIAEIDKQEAEFKKKNKEAGKSSTLSKEQSSALTKAKELAKQDKDKQTSEVYKEELSVMRNYLKEYGSLEQQKLAITEDYEEKIKKAQTKGEKLQLEQEKKKTLANMTYENISMGIDWKGLLSGVGNMSKEMLKPMLDQLEAYTNTDEFKQAGTENQQKVVDLMQEIRSYLGTDQNATWVSLAEAIDKFNLSVSDYKSAVDNEKKANATLQTAKEDLKSGKITKEVFENIKKKSDEASQAVVDAKNKMNTFGVQLNSTTDAVKNYTSGLTAALNKLDAWKGVEGYSDIKSSISSIDAAKGALDTSLSTMTDGAMKTLGSQISSKMGSVLNTIGGDVTKIFSSGIGSIVGFVAQIPKLILNLADSIKNFVTGILNSFTELLKFEWMSDLVNSILDAVGNLIDAIFDLPENLFKVLEKITVNGVGGLVNNVLGRVGNVLSLGKLSSSGPASWFTNSNAAKVNKNIENLTKSNDELNKSISRLEKVISESTGTKAKEAYEEAKSKQEQINKQTLQKAKEQASYHSAHHSWSSSMNNFRVVVNEDGSIEYSTNGKEIEKEILKATGGKKKSLWDLTPEEMNKLLTSERAKELIKTSGANVYGRSVLEKLEDYADLAGKIDDLTAEFYESVTSISFDSMYDSFISNLMDMDKSAQDFADDFTEYLQKAMVSFLVADSLQPELKKLYNEWAQEIADSGGNLSKDRVDYYRNKYESLGQLAINKRDQLSQITGYTGESSSSQSATSGGWQSMGQDTADELNGRFTALQIAGETIANDMATNVAQMETIVNLGISTNGAVLEIRNMMIMTNSYLEDIVKYAKLSYTEFGTKMDDMVKHLKKI